MKFPRPLTLLLAASSIVFVSTFVVLALRNQQSENSHNNAPATAAETLRDSILQDTITLSEFEKGPVTADQIQLAKQRMENMRELIEEVPQQALELAISYSDYAALPADLKPYFERPFSKVLNSRVIAVCDTDHNTPETFLSLENSKGESVRIERSETNRFSISKENAPVQGIELDGNLAIRNQLFHRIDSADVAWAQQNLPLANSKIDSTLLAATGESPDAVFAVSGGYLFAFSSEESLRVVESSLRAADAYPGLNRGSPALFEALAADHAKPFSLTPYLSEQSLLVTDETRDYLIIRTDFSDKPGSPVEKDDLEALVDNVVSPKLAEYSYNKTSVDVVVTEDVYRLPSPSSNYFVQINGVWYIDTQKIYDDALSVFINAGNINPNLQFDHISISFPKLTEDWAGLASIGGREQWLQGFPSANTILHELGHNYGLFHATYWQYDFANAASLDPVDPTGDEEDYGDIYDVMGDGAVENGHFHMAGKRYLGWLSESQTADVAEAADSGTYRLYRFDNVSATGLQGVRIKKTDTDGYYWVGYRSSYTGIPHLAKGAYLVWQQPDSYDPDTVGFSNNKSLLIDTTPGSEFGKADAGISLGRTYSDAEAEVHITPTKTGQDSQGPYLDVVINMGSFSGNQAPTGSLTAATTGTARTPIAFSFTGSDPDGDTLSYDWNFGDGTVEKNQSSIEHSFPFGGTFTLTLTVSDMKGGSFTQQATIEVSDPIANINIRDSGVSYDLRTVAANDECVIATGNGNSLVRSTDGVNWTQHRFEFSSDFFVMQDLIWDGSRFIASGSDYDTDIQTGFGIIYSSQDGISWTELHRTSELVNDFGFTSLATNPSTGVIVAVREDTKLEVFDGVDTWTTVDFGKSPEVWRRKLESPSITWTGTHFIVAGVDFVTSNLTTNQILLRSADGVEWEDISEVQGFESYQSISQVAYLNGMLLGSGFMTHIGYSANEGSDWINTGTDPIYRAYGFAYGNGIHSVFGAIDVKLPGEVEDGSEDIPQNFLSTNGRTWGAAGSPEDNVTYKDRTFFKDTFISVGNAGVIHQTDPFESPATNPFESWIVGFVTDSSQRGALANPDGDWAPNFLEYALGSNPSDPNSVPDQPSLELDPDSGYASIYIPRLSETEAVLAIEISTDLEIWSPLSTSATTDTSALLVLTSSAPIDITGPVFFRIKASLP